MKGFFRTAEDTCRTEAIERIGEITFVRYTSTSFFNVFQWT